MKSIVTLTMNPSVDYSSTVDHVVAERKLRCGASRYEPGGGGINVSRVIKRFDEKSLAIYIAGGLTGHMLQDLLDREGLDHRPVPVRDLTRINFMVIEEATGLQFRFGMPGPTLTEPEWQRCLLELSAIQPKPDYIVASGSLPPGVPDDFYARVVRISRELGARLIVDTSGEALCAAVKAGVYLFKPNMRELQGLIGRNIRDESQLEISAREVVERGGSEIVVVSLGAAGALMVTRERSERIRAPTVPIGSKVGAGDSMVAGIVLSLARGVSVREAVRFGVAAGAAAVMTPASELCRKEDAERLYQSMLSQVS